MAFQLCPVDSRGNGIKEGNLLTGSHQAPWIYWIPAYGGKTGPRVGETNGYKYDSPGQAVA